MATSVAMQGMMQVVAQVRAQVTAQVIVKVGTDANAGAAARPCTGNPADIVSVAPPPGRASDA